MAASSWPQNSPMLMRDFIAGDASLPNARLRRSLVCPLPRSSKSVYTGSFSTNSPLFELLPAMFSLLMPRRGENCPRPIMNTQASRLWRHARGDISILYLRWLPPMSILIILIFTAALHASRDFGFASFFILIPPARITVIITPQRALILARGIMIAALPPAPHPLAISNAASYFSPFVGWLALSAASKGPGTRRYSLLHSAASIVSFHYKKRYFGRCNMAVSFFSGCRASPVAVNDALKRSCITIVEYSFITRQHSA